MTRTRLALLVLLVLTGCNRQPAKPSEGNLIDARRNFKTKLTRQEAQHEPAPVPPAKLFQLVRYESPAGKMAAYLSQPPKDGKKHPAIIWIFGGFGNDIGETAWQEQPAKNDQSASAFRKAGIVMMYPSFRGGNDNPGFQEGFYGEVDDVLAAVDFLAKQDFVDPQRIYLGGHSTGGTMALLSAECSDRFRAVFSFGPVEDVSGYGGKNLPFNLSDPKEIELRAPERWLHCIRNPVFVFEGTGGNIGSLQALQKASTNAQVHFYPVQGVDHFGILAPMTRLIAGKVVSDTGPTCNIAFSEDEVAKAVGK